ncbi:ABC transporter permease [Arachnia propionica]|jgi:ribose transport system permease protein rbsC|uniref:ABC transporter permease n=1 Tax=Arachnia propionica TaxID=1750 RepID=A0A3N4D4W0_9ACTN|nr:ABC transporter permease [Arachnia propionica]AFN47530.1 ribose transport system permease protein RbsC [Arachnia propionica F0230a]QCT36661.1 ABC transporter permease [Arachnia propionica]QUC11008.1 ABC transporter permease [Arachnia propionica]QUC14308.1 ABC transporter permease [Arachnia propionica]RPA17873.1 ABC transporter permease [Arachnia propionica]
MNTKETAAKLPRLNSTNLTSAAVLIALAVLLSVISPAFRDPQNLINILQQVTVNAILALGMTMVIFTGGIDLSVGSVVAFSGIVMGILVIDLGVNPWLAALIGIALGSVCGTINGLLISRFKLQPMIATLGMMSIARGAALTLAGGRTISGYPPGFTWLGNGTIPGTTIPVQIVFMLLLYVIAYYFMRYRRFGRALYSVGGNEEATRLSGINVFKYKTLAYTVSGALAGIASVVLVAKLNSAQSIAGQDYELDAIASAVIGGASLLGGKGSIWGTLMGALIIGVIRNGLNLLNVSSYLQKLIIGFIILIAVLVDAFRNRERS